jgi:hypothetical protein
MGQGTIERTQLKTVTTGLLVSSLWKAGRVGIAESIWRRRKNVVPSPAPFREIMEEIGVMDLDCVVIEGKLGASKDAPQKALAVNPKYCEVILALLEAVIGLMRARNHHLQNVTVLRLSPEWTSIMSRTSRNVDNGRKHEQHQKEWQARKLHKNLNMPCTSTWTDVAAVS